jgi:hypothetical protein
MPDRSRQAAAAIYGTITVGVVLAVESAQRETYLETLGASLIALALYWLAHAYAESAATRLRDGLPLTPGHVLHALAQELSILAGAVIPLLALLLAWALGASLATGVSIAIWTSAATVVLIELRAAMRAAQTWGARLAQVAMGALFALLIIALRVALH